MSVCRLATKEIKLAGAWNYRFCLDIIPAAELHAKEQVYKIAGSICHRKALKTLGNLWYEIDAASARQGISDGLRYDLAYTNHQLFTQAISSADIGKINLLLQDQEIICCLTNTEKNTWRGTGGCAAFAGTAGGDKATRG